MKYLSSIAIAFSLYSKIPMPSFKWDEDNYKHAISFLPLIGFVISLLSYGLIYVGTRVEIPVFVMTLLLMLIPLLVTGGFHLDGFIDVQDALHSYQPKEKKLEIMKDPHIGAFAMIGSGVLMLIWMAASYMLVYKAWGLDNRSPLLIYIAIFPFVRAFCGISSIVFNNAKKDGMLSTETGKSGAVDIVVLSLQAVGALAFMVMTNLLLAVALAVSMAFFILWYKVMCTKQFGGVTGDTAGFFVVSGEAFMLIVLAIFCIFVL